MSVQAGADGWELVRRVQAGDMEAFGEIYREHHDQVLRFAMRRLGNRPTAEDITSETFVRALRRIQTVSWQGRPVEAWLVTIARNLIADFYKSGRYRLEVLSGDICPDRPVEAPGPEQLAIESLTASEIHAALLRLSPPQRQAVRLRFLHDLSTAETAAAMGSEPVRVKSVVYRALRRLEGEHLVSLREAS